MSSQPKKTGWGKSVVVGSSSSHDDGKESEMEKGGKSNRPRSRKVANKRSLVPKGDIFDLICAFVTKVHYDGGAREHTLPAFVSVRHGYIIHRTFFA